MDTYLKPYAEGIKDLIVALYHVGMNIVLFLSLAIMVFGILISYILGFFMYWKSPAYWIMSVWPFYAIGYLNFIIRHNEVAFSFFSFRGLKSVWMCWKIFLTYPYLQYWLKRHQA